MPSLGESAYGRSKEAEVEEIMCDSCKEHKVCLCTDSSDGEYGSVNLCFNCIQNLFADYGSPDVNPLGERALASVEHDHN
jgi:hypothetical protein